MRHRILILICLTLLYLWVQGDLSYCNCSFLDHALLDFRSVTHHWKVLRDCYDLVHRMARRNIWSRGLSGSDCRTCLVCGLEEVMLMAALLVKLAATVGVILGVVLHVWRF